MSEDCLFCQIINGEIPSNTVYEDEETVAFLDVNPLARGHTLVIPKTHYETLAEMPADISGEVFGTASEVAPAVEAAVGADATTVAINNGEAAGQEVPHVHLHVVPREAEDGIGPIHSLFRDRPEVGDDELADIGADIAAEL